MSFSQGKHKAPFVGSSRTEGFEVLKRRRHATRLLFSEAGFKAFHKGSL